MSSTDQNLLDPSFLRRLEKLKLQTRRAFPGVMRGERRSTRRGSSVEFADFRKYETGDDFRHVDWSIYARMERLMLKQFVEEEDVRIDILIDQSRSMHFGKPRTKFDFARRAAAALAFIGMSSLDRVGVISFDSSIRARLRAMGGRGSLLNLIRFLNSLSRDPEGPADSEGGRIPETTREPRALAEVSSQATNLSNVLRSYRRVTPRPGVLIVISDFMDSGDYRREMKVLSKRGYDLNLIQVLAPEEIHPELLGHVDLVDSETGERREITVNEGVLAAYRDSLAHYTRSLEAFCRSNGLGYTFLTADVSFEDELLKKLVENRIAG
jgi:uncharacterized protein (DUF58 family)